MNEINLKKELHINKQKLIKNALSALNKQKILRIKDQYLSLFL